MIRRFSFSTSRPQASTRKNAWRFRNLISSFSQDKIVILSTHIVSDVEYIADDILIMKAGAFAAARRARRRGLEHRREGMGVPRRRTRGRRHGGAPLREQRPLRRHGARRGARHSGGAPRSDAQQEPPTLEDLYLHLFNDQVAAGPAVEPTRKARR